jgi:hypothetical protein
MIIAFHLVQAAAFLHIGVELETKGFQVLHRLPVSGRQVSPFGQTQGIYEDIQRAARCNPGIELSD